MVLNICIKFHDGILKGFDDFVTETDTYKIQRDITKKIYSKSYGSCALHVVQCWIIFI